MKNVRADVRKYLLCGLNIAQKKGVNMFSYMTPKSIHIVVVDSNNTNLYFSTRKHDGTLIAETYLPID